MVYGGNKFILKRGRERETDDSEDSDEGENIFFIPLFFSLLFCAFVWRLVLQSWRRRSAALCAHSLFLFCFVFLVSVCTAVLAEIQQRW